MHLSNISTIQFTKRWLPHEWLTILYFGLPRCGKEPTCQCRRCKRRGFHPCVGKTPWRRAWQPTPVFLHGESHRQKSLVGYSPWGRKELVMTQGLTHTCWNSAFMGIFYIMSLWEMKILSVLFIWWLTITLDEYICLNKQWFWHHTLPRWKHHDWPSLTITWYKEMWSSMSCYLVSFFRLNLPLISWTAVFKF